MDGIVTGYIEPNTGCIIKFSVPFAYYNGKKIINSNNFCFMEAYPFDTEIIFFVTYVKPKMTPFGFEKIFSIKENIKEVNLIFGNFDYLI